MFDLEMPYYWIKDIPDRRAFAFPNVSLAFGQRLFDIGAVSGVLHVVLKLIGAPGALYEISHKPGQPRLISLRQSPGPRELKCQGFIHRVNIPPKSLQISLCDYIPEACDARA